MSQCFLCGHSLTPCDEPNVNQVCGICRASFKPRDLMKAIRKRMKQIGDEWETKTAEKKATQ